MSTPTPDTSRRLSLYTLYQRMRDFAVLRRPDVSNDEKRLITFVRPYTMTSAERILALLDATRHIVRQQIPGDIAECGVWRGGSMMLVARALAEAGDTTRHLYLYDTFEGMTPPTPEDRSCDGRAATEQLDRARPGTSVWCLAGLAEVKRNLTLTGYPPDKIHFVPGPVEETIPATLPESLAMLRLDTDWYASTKHELTHLFPRLMRSGFLIIDDYGHWLGAKKAVDEYIDDNDIDLFLQRIDYTGRIARKP